MATRPKTTRTEAFEKASFRTRLRHLPAWREAKLLSTQVPASPGRAKKEPGAILADVAVGVMASEG
eukprot:2193461-Lingulodinium_polyedra.AAC.1